MQPKVAGFSLNTAPICIDSFGADTTGVLDVGFCLFLVFPSETILPRACAKYKGVGLICAFLQKRTLSLHGCKYAGMAVSYESKRCNVVVLGSMGHGKSTVANKILCHDHFLVDARATAVTETVSCGERVVEGPCRQGHVPRQGGRHNGIP